MENAHYEFSTCFLFLKHSSQKRSKEFDINILVMSFPQVFVSPHTRHWLSSEQESQMHCGCSFSFKGDFFKISIGPLRLNTKYYVGRILVFVVYFLK
jgi:hypothetical protein